MRRLLFLLPLLLLSALPAHAQLANARGWCEDGAQVVVTSGLNSTTQVQASFAPCSIAVSVHGGGAATIFSTGSSTPLSNPFTSQSNGQWIFYAANGEYDITMSGAGFPSPVTYSDVFIGGGSGGIGTVTSFSAGNLSPLFTSSVANPTITPALTFLQVAQSANLFYGGPSTGSAANPTFRSLVAADLPIGISCAVAGGVGFENGTLNTLTCNSQFLWDNSNIRQYTGVPQSTFEASYQNWLGTNPAKVWVANEMGGAQFTTAFFQMEGLAGTSPIGIWNSTHAHNSQPEVLFNEIFGEVDNAQTVGLSDNINLSTTWHGPGTVTVHHDVFASPNYGGAVQVGTSDGYYANFVTAGTGELVGTANEFRAGAPVAPANTATNVYGFHAENQGVVGATLTAGVLVDAQTAGAQRWGFFSAPTNKDSFGSILSGADNSVAGSVQTANGSANAHTIWASAATTSNTIKGFATTPTTTDVVTCVSSGTTCTLTDGGFPAFNPAIPGAIGGTTPSTGKFTALTLTAAGSASSNLATPACGANVSPVTVSVNTTNDQNLMACSLSAGYLNTVSRTLLIHVKGVYSTPVASSATINLKLKLCTVSGCGSGTVITPITITSSANPGTVTNNSFLLDSYVTTQTAGASAAFEASGEFVIDLGSLTTSPDTVFADTNAATVGTIDSTAALFLQVTVAFSAGSASNSATERQLIVETLQ